MAVPTQPLTLGIEEEYQIIDPQTRDLRTYISELLTQDQIRAKKLDLKPELMQSQVEVGSHICRNIKEARAEIVRLRRDGTVIETIALDPSIAEPRGLAVAQDGTLLVIDIAPARVVRLARDGQTLGAFGADVFGGWAKERMAPYKVPREVVVVLLKEVFPSPRLFAEGQQPAPGGGHAKARRGIARAHEAELHQPLGLHLGVGARVEQDVGPLARHRDGRGDGGAVDTLHPTHAQQGRRHRGPGVAGGHHCTGRAVAHGLGGAHQRGVLLAANPLRRVIVHLDDFRGTDEW